MIIYLSTWMTDRSLGKSLTKKNASHRLLSYFFLFEQKINKKLLLIYHKTGKCDPRKGKG